MKFFKKDKTNINTADKTQENIPMEYIVGSDVKKIKKNRKENVSDEILGLGNTTNLENDGPKKCIGCGKQLQTIDDTRPGFVKNIEIQSYCFRCFRIKHYNRLIEYEIDDSDFIEVLKQINNSPKKIRYYYVVDVFDFPGSRIKWLEELIAQKEVIILINKIDLIPKQINKMKIMNYAKKFFTDSPIVNPKFILTSSMKLDYVFTLLKELKSINYDQYIVGISNAGKSSLINACLKENQQIPSIVTSKYVNTTLDKIKINFTNNNYVYDTPGLVKKHHIASTTTSNYWDFFFFKKEIKQITFQLLPNQSIFFGGLAWFSFYGHNKNDSSKNKQQKTSFHFYTNKQMPLHRTKTDNATNYFKKNRHNLIPKLLDPTQKFENKDFIFDDEKNIDLHISGLGWINFKTYKGLKVSMTVPKTKEGINVVILPSIF